MKAEAGETAASNQLPAPAPSEPVAPLDAVGDRELEHELPDAEAK